MPGFLDGILGNLFGGVTQQAGNQLTQALFGHQGRMSNEDFQFYQDLLDSGNPREIQRQNDFLQGTTGTKITTYNEYQDETMPEDTRRQDDRIKQMGKDLGMSPWEIAGAGGASPLPSPGAPQGNSNAPSGGGSQFLSAMMPLQIAKMNNDTALQQTRMNNDTQLKQTSMTTDDGNTAKTQNAFTAQQTLKALAETDLTWKQVDATQQRMVLDTIQSLAANLPTESVDIAGYTQTQRKGIDALKGLYLQSQKGMVSQGEKGAANSQAAMSAALAKMPKGDLDLVSIGVAALAGAAGKGLGALAKGAGDAAGEFLGGMSKPVAKTATQAAGKAAPGLSKNNTKAYNYLNKLVP